MKRLIVFFTLFVLIWGCDDEEGDISSAVSSPEKAYLTPEGVSLYLKEMRGSHPQITGLEKIGKSTDGNYPVYAFTVSNGDGSRKPVFLYVGGTHGDENVTVYIALKIIETAVNDAELLKMVDFAVIPVLNPYGLSNEERKTDDGVDLNRNFSFGWEKTSTSGVSPMDQGESKALASYLAAHTFSIAVFGHSGAKCISTLWDYIGETSSLGQPSAYSSDDFRYYYLPAFDLIYSRAVSYRDAVRKNGYSGYSVTEGYDWYPSYGTIADWAYFEYGIVSYTIEFTEKKNFSSGEESSLKKVWSFHESALMDMASFPEFFLKGKAEVGQAIKITAVRESRSNRDPVPYTSFCYADRDTGLYYLPLSAGMYTVKFSSNGTDISVVNGVEITNGAENRLDEKE